jgi:iron-sulfur cluster assembly protein
MFELPIVPAGAATTVNDLLRLTPVAAGKAREMLAREGVPALRIGVRGGGCSGQSYVMEYCRAEEEGDLVIDSHGVRVVIDRKSAQLLGGTVLDYESGLLESGFKFINPNARHACSCGESFAV